LSGVLIGMVGRKYKNRVRIYRVRRIVMADWWWNGKQCHKSFGRVSDERALEMAREKAEQLRVMRKALQRKTDRQRVLMRADMIRVARLTGLPDGVAPRRNDYRRLGRFGAGAIQTQEFGYADGDPIESWAEGVRRLGLETTRERHRITDAKAIADIKRVAVECGDATRLPTQGQYEERGKWAYRALMNHFGFRRWLMFADLLGMETTVRQKASANCADVRWGGPHSIASVSRRGPIRKIRADKGTKRRAA
jgi:hypothetical protein